MKQFGQFLEESIRLYLAQHGLNGLGALNGRIINELGDRIYKDYEAKRKKALQLASEADWLQSVIDDPMNAGVDVRAELARCEFWCKNNQKSCTRRRFTNWLLNPLTPRPVSGGFSPASASKAPDPYKEPAFDWRRAIAQRWPREDYPHREAWEEMLWLEVPISRRRDLIAKTA